MSVHLLNSAWALAKIEGLMRTTLTVYWSSSYITAKLLNLALLALIYSDSTQEELIERRRYPISGGTVRQSVESYENLYSDPTVCTSNLHGILHLTDCVKNGGPTRRYWQFRMEKTCGNVVSWLQGNKLKDESVSNAIVLHQQVNLMWEEAFVQDTALSSLTGLDIVTSAFVTARPQSRCSPYVSCPNYGNETYFGDVDRLLSCTWHRKDYRLALVKVFDEILYASNQDEIYGRVQALKSPKWCLVCCTVGITYTKQEYILDQNWVDCDLYDFIIKSAL
ncbi:hypothetical protein V1523DRAFT_441025 [Lipomyces doorenjongii]